MSFRAVWRSLLVSVGLASLTATALAQFAYTGSDDFNYPTLTVGAGNRWVASSGTGSFTFTVANNRLEFAGATSTASPVFSNRAQLVWFDSTTSNLSYTDNWEATVSATRTATGLTGRVQIGLEVSMAGTDSGVFGVYLYRDGGIGDAIFAENRAYLTGSYQQAGMPSSVAESDTTDVLLRINWVASTATFFASYSTNGGLNYTAVGSATPDSGGTLDDWAVAPITGFRFAASTMSALDTIGAGTLYLDNMVVATAVPEPSVLALCFGLGALGLALWRKRRSCAP